MHQVLSIDRAFESHAVLNIALNHRQEQGDIVLTRGQGISVRSIDEWLDVRGLDRRIRSSDSAIDLRYDIL